MRTLEDFSPGQVFAGAERELVTTEEVIRFAERYDPQFFHLDDAAAKNSLFGKLASSGWMTAGLTIRLLIASGIDIQGGMIGKEIESLRWPRPTYPGDELRVVSTILDVIPSRSKPDRGTVRMRTDTLNQRDEVVMTMTSALFVPCRRQNTAEA